MPLPLPLPRGPTRVPHPLLSWRRGRRGLPWHPWGWSQISGPGVTSLRLRCSPAAPGPAQGLGLRPPTTQPQLELPHVTPRPSPLSPSPHLLQVALRVTMAMQPLSSAVAFPEESGSWLPAGDTSSGSFVPERRSGVGRSSGMRAEHCVSRSPRPTLCSPTDCSRPGSSVHRDCPGKGPGVGCHTLLQGVSA